MREIEVKYRVRDAAALFAALKGLGIELGAPVARTIRRTRLRAGFTGMPGAGCPFARLRTVGGRQRHRR